MKVVIRDTLRQLARPLRRMRHQWRVRARFCQPAELPETTVTRQSADPESLSLPEEFLARSRSYRRQDSASFKSEEVHFCSFPHEVSVHEAKFIRLGPDRYLDAGLQSIEPWPILGEPFSPRTTRSCGKLLVPWGHGGASYGDFLIKVLPKLARLLAAIPASERADVGVCLPHFTRHPWAVDYLRLLGLRGDQIHDESATVIVPPGGTLILGSGPQVGHGIAHPGDLRAMLGLLQQAKPPSENPPWRRLYISRKTGRRMVNEDDLLDGLTVRGFECLQLEDLSLDEQIFRFQEAAMIVGPHGAGHANILWSPPGTRLLEVFHPEWMHPCYALLSQMLGLRYHCLVGRSGRSRGAWTEKSRYGIFENPAIETAAFFAKLDALLDHGTPTNP